MKHLFCLEGPNGSGKTTMISSLESRLCLKGLSIICFRDIDTPELLECRKEIKLADLYGWKNISCRIAEARKQSYDNNLVQVAKEGDLILLERGYYTSGVYESEDLRELDQIISLNLEIGIPKPKKTFILLPPVHLLSQRVFVRDKEEMRNRERKKLEQQWEKYYYIASKYRECVQVDTSRPFASCIKEIERYILEAVEYNE